MDRASARRWSIDIPMGSTTSIRDGGGAEPPELSTSEVFAILASDRRRAVLRYLNGRVGGVSLGELAEHLAIRTDDPTFERYERILVGLLHRDLPRLADAGLLAYDGEAETVTGRPAADRLRPYLVLASAEDVR